MSALRILKIFGWVMVGFAGVLAGIAGYLGITGGFKPPYVPIESIYFESTQINIHEDSEIYVLANPENTTELDIELSIISGFGRISLPETAKIGEPIEVKVLKDENGYNIGGSVRIRASQGLRTTEAEVFVDVPVERFSIASTKAGNIYVGDIFQVYPTDVVPYNALTVGEQTKQVKYYSSDESIATVNELTGQVRVLEQGEFEITARVFATYELAASIQTFEEYLNELEENNEDTTYAQLDYQEYLSERSEEKTRGFTVSGIEVTGISVSDSEENPLHTLYLYEEYIFTPEDFDLELLPQPDSNFTSDELAYKLKDLIVEASSSALSVEVVSTEPLMYKVKAVEFEIWQTEKTNIRFSYVEEGNTYSAEVHFKLLRNDIVDIQVETSEVGSIEVTLSGDEPEVINLEDITTIVPEEESVAPTYNLLRYKILNSAQNEFGEDVIAYDTETGYLLDNKITPLHRGTVSIEALVLLTDAEGNPLLNEQGEYIELRAEGALPIIVNVLEELTALDMKLKKLNFTEIKLGDTLELKLVNLTANQTENYDTLFNIVSSDESVLMPDNEITLEGNTLTVNFEALSVDNANIFIMDTTTKIFIDYIEVQVKPNTEEGEVATYELDINNYLDSIIRGSEAVLILEPSSQGGLIDAYEYGKINFVSTNEDMISVNVDTDKNKNIIVKIMAVGFNLDEQLSYSNIRAFLTDNPSSYLINERVNVDLGAVNGIYLTVNNNNIQAVPQQGGTKWLTDEGESLLPTIIFTNPSEPAITGVEYLSSDESILEIDNSQIDDNGVPGFIFKKAGTVTLTARSLDEYAVPTDPENEDLGAYSSVVLNVTVPNVVTDFTYNMISYEEVVAGDSVDLLANEVLVDYEYKSRIRIEKEDGTDYTSLAYFELETSAENSGAVSLSYYNLNGNSMPLLNTYEIGKEITVRVRVYTDFGFEAYYEVKVVPNIDYTIIHKGGLAPEVVYPPVGSFEYISLLQEQDGLKRVDVKTKSGSSLNNVLEFELSSEAFASLDYNNKGSLYIFTPISEEFELNVKIYIEYASGIDFEAYYYFLIKPNADIYFDYSNSVNEVDYQYQQIDYASVYDLILNDNVSATTVTTDEYGNVLDITNNLTFELISANSYVTLDNNGLLTIAPITEDQYISIKVSVDDYYEIYRIKILA